MSSSIIFDLWDLDFSEMGIGSAMIAVVVMLVLCIILIRKPKFHPYFENFSLKEIKKK
jgi:MATE family multidrug resistance protein